MVLGDLVPGEASKPPAARQCDGGRGKRASLWRRRTGEPGKVGFSVNVFEDPGTQRKEETNRRLGRRALQMGRRYGQSLMLCMTAGADTGDTAG